MLAIVRSIFVTPTSFNLEDYDVVTGSHPALNYLYSGRKISEKTIRDFMGIQAVLSVRRKNSDIWNVAFPYKRQGETDIVNFELRNKGFNGKSYKSFCSGGIKSTACWIASFSPYHEVRQLYISESAIDMMSLYELSGLNVNCQCAFVSTGGNLIQGQINRLKELFPNAIVNLCNDNDMQGRIFNVLSALYYRGIEAKAYRDKANKIVNLDINSKLYFFDEDRFWVV